MIDILVFGITFLIMLALVATGVGLVVSTVVKPEPYARSIMLNTLVNAADATLDVVSAPVIGVWLSLIHI